MGGPGSGPRKGSGRLGSTRSSRRAVKKVVRQTETRSNRRHAAKMRQTTKRFFEK